MDQVMTSIEATIAALPVWVRDGICSADGRVRADAAAVLGRHIALDIARARPAIADS